MRDGEEVKAREREEKNRESTRLGFAQLPLLLLGSGPVESHISARKKRLASLLIFDIIESYFLLGRASLPLARCRTFPPTASSSSFESDFRILPCLSPSPTMCSSRDIPDDLRHIDHSNCSSRDPSPEGTPIPSARDTTFDYEQEHRLKSVSWAGSLFLLLLLLLLQTQADLVGALLLQADSHFFAHQIRTSPTTPLLSPQPQQPTPPFLTTRRSHQGPDALDLEEELLLKEEGVTFEQQSVVVEEPEEEDAQAGPSGTSGGGGEGGASAEPNHERGHSMHEG